MIRLGTSENHYSNSGKIKKAFFVINSWSSNSILMNIFLLCSSLHPQQNKKKERQNWTNRSRHNYKQIFFQRKSWGIQPCSEKNRFCDIPWSISPILMIFFFICRERGKLHNKKMFIEIESLDHEIIAKNDFFFIFPEFE
jgi:hypothetical protein